MRQSSWMKADIFRRIPKDLTEATVSGAVISILCVAVMLLLFTGEVISYVFPRTQSDMMVDNDKAAGQRLKVFLDLDMLQLPCALVSVDVVDMLKNHEVDSSANLQKIPLSPSGEEIAGRKNPNEMGSAEEGCRLKGFILVTKVPGNFHISAHSRVDLARRRFPQGLSLSHVIRTLSFEPQSAAGVSRFAEPDSRPLEGTVKRSAPSMSHQYFLEVVPTLYAGTLSTTRTYQYTAAEKSMAMPPGAMGMLVFSHQLSPIAVRYSSGRVSFTHFLTYVCAIISGVYTVAELLSRFVYNSTTQIQRRFMGKAD